MHLLNVPIGNKQQKLMIRSIKVYFRFNLFRKRR